jgi:hypothetical protein
MKQPESEEAAEDAAAIKQIIITNVQKLDEDQRTDTKVISCWNKLARDLTMRRTSITDQPLMNMKSKQSNLHYKEDIAT